MQRVTSVFLVSLISALGLLTVQTAGAQSRDYISIVGSSTVYPFATVVAEKFGTKSEFATPKVESTGSGGGLKLFCSGVGLNRPDITNASRRIKQSEIDRCAENGVNGIVEIKFGYDGIVIANSIDEQRYELTKQQVFLALAKDVPSLDGAERLVPNPYTNWSDIDDSLPEVAIRVLGPPPTSGTRDAFAELALEGGCETFDWIKAMKNADKSAYKSVCHTVREDGHWVEAGENDNIIVQKIQADPRSLGVFGYSFLDQNYDVLHGATIDGVEPSFENIVDGLYGISRSLFFYVKKAHLEVVPGIREFVKEFTSERAWGEEGYLVDTGLIPMPEEERKMFRAAGENTTLLTSL